MVNLQRPKIMVPTAEDGVMRYEAGPLELEIVLTVRCPLWVARVIVWVKEQKHMIYGGRHDE